MTQSSNYSRQLVESVHYWAQGLLTFRMSRPEGFRFSPGHYARLGLQDETNGLVWRPFSMVSAPDDSSLEFLAKLVPEGVFSGLLRSVQPGSVIALDPHRFGFLTTSSLKQAQALWMLASGTGLGPFISIVRAAKDLDPFERLVIVHSVRLEEELAYRDELESLSRDAKSSVLYIPIVTREQALNTLGKRIPQLIESGALQDAAQMPLEATHSCVMVCGNPELCADLRALLIGMDFRTTRRGVAGNLAFEKYW